MHELNRPLTKALFIVTLILVEIKIPRGDEMRKFLIPMVLFFLVGFVNAQPMFDFDGTQQNQEEISKKVNVPTPLALKSPPIRYC